MENTKTQRLSEKGLFLTATETAQLQQHGVLDIEVPLYGESAYYAFALFDWLQLPQGAVKVALPPPANSIWLKADAITFNYHRYFKNIRVPSSVSVRISYEIFVM